MGANMLSISNILRGIHAKVRLGQVRATVLKQIKNLEEGIEDLSEGKAIKEKELKMYQKEELKKASLKKQIVHMKRATSVLKHYKKYTTS
jgi:hypothetical protein